MEKLNKSESSILRQKAEEQLKIRKESAGIDAARNEYTAAEMLKLLHEFEVHQIELELQNQELIQAKEQAIIASEKYIELYDFTPTGYFTLSRKGEIIQLNISGAKMLGKERSQLVNRLFHLYISDNSKLLFIQFLEKVFDRHEKEFCELTLPTNDDTPMYVYITGIVSGNGSNCLITAIDITERKLLESNIVEKMILLNETERAGKIGGWSFNVESLTQKWTQETFNILEISTTQGEPKVPEGIEFIDDSCRRAAEIAIKRAIEFGEPFNQEWKVTTAKGNKRWVNAVGKANKVNGKIISVTGSFQDITERKKVEEALQESEEKYHTIFNNIQDVFYQTDLAGTVLDVSPSIKYYSEFKREEIVGKPVTNIYYDPKDRDNVLGLLREKGEFMDYELRLKTKTGDLKYGSINARLVFDADGKPSHIDGAIRDITERKLADEQVKRLNRVYSVLSNINQTIVRNRDKQLLFEEACRIAVENGGFKMAWMGMINHTTNKVDVVASSGITGEYINTVNIDLNNKTQNSGPAGMAIKTGKHIYSNNIETDEKMIPWRKNAEKYLFRSVIALPIIVWGKTIGVYMIYSGEIDFFNEDEIHLLEELATDISFALEFIESEMERKLAEKALKENNSRLELALQSANMAWWEMDIKTGNVIFDKRKTEMLGYSAENFKHYNDFVALVHPEDVDKTMKAMQNHINGLVDKYEIEYRILCKSGEYKWFYDIGSIVKKDANGLPLYVTGLVIDIAQRKLAEESLRKSEAIQRKIVSNIGDVIVIIDQNGINRYKSPNIETLFGWKPEELLGKSTWDVVHPDDLDSAQKIIAEIALIPNATVTTENRYRRKDGEYVWIEVTIVNLLDDPDIQGFLGNYHDITDRKLALAKIREKDLEFKKLSSNLPDLIFQFTRKPDGTFYVPIASEGIKNIFGCSPEDVINDFTPISRVIHPDDIERVITDIEYSAKHLTFFTCEFRVQIPGKSIQWIYSKSTPEKLPDGSVTWYGFNADISEHKRVEESLLKLKTAIDKSEISVVITDSNGNIEYANPFFTKLSGYLPEEYIGKTPRVLKSAYHPKEFYTEMWNTIKSGKTWEGEFYNCNKNGEMYWENAIISPIANSNNEITHFVAIKTDVTNTKNINAELIIAKEQAEESDRLKSAFLANMSHEIRTPMNGILGFTELLKEPDLDDNQQKYYISIIENSGVRLLNIINNIIDISKIESGQMKVKITKINVNEQLTQILDFFNPEAKVKNIKLICNPGLPNDEAFLKTDSEKFYAVLINLVKNALKYTETGFIEFGYNHFVETQNIVETQCFASLQFYVKDTGIGIPKDRLEAIFERFIQADIADKMARQGAGLGLSISKAYVEMLKGKIWVESEEGIGSTFYFTLPGFTEPKEKATVKNGIQAVTEGTRVGNLKVLIAEDDEASNHLISIYVRKFGKKIINVQNGRDAVETCRDNPDINLILMDIQMPELNGYEATRQIRQFNTEVTIIALTAFALAGDRQKAIEAGCNDYISKPVKMFELVEIIQKYFKE
jgi:hypothetical protein